MSTLNVANVTDGTTSVPTGYVVNGSAKAWIQFNGINTVAISDSFNFSSVTDNGVGWFSPQFTNNMGSGVYGIQSHDHSYGNGWSESNSTTGYSMRRRNETGSYIDSSKIWSLVHGDLA